MPFKLPILPSRPSVCLPCTPQPVRPASTVDRRVSVIGLQPFPSFVLNALWDALQCSWAPLLEFSHLNTFIIRA